MDCASSIGKRKPATTGSLCSRWIALASRSTRCRRTCCSNSTPSSSAWRWIRPRALVIRSVKTSGFIAGADIREFQEFDAKGTVNDAMRRGQQVFQRLAELPCPTVAAIHGFCMGGGTELALACRYRVAIQRSVDPDRPAGSEARHLSRLGRQRAPAALVGAPAAMDMMLTGRTLSASAATRDRPGRQGGRCGGAGRCGGRAGNEGHASARSSSASSAGRPTPGRRDSCWRRCWSSRSRARRARSTTRRRMR